MSFMRGFSKVDKEGRVAIPKNIRREAQLEEGQMVEVKLQGPGSAQYVSIRARKQGR